MAMAPQNYTPGEDAERDFELGLPGFRYSDLYRPERLAALSVAFDGALLAADPALAAEVAVARKSPAWPTDAKAGAVRSELMIRLARHVDAFVARLFGVEAELAAQHAVVAGEAVVFRVKKDFLQRRALKVAAEPGADAAALAREVHRICRAVRPDHDQVAAVDADRATALAIADLLDIEAAHDLVRKGKASALPEAIRELEASVVEAWAPGGNGREVVATLLATCERWARARNVVEHRRPAAARSALFRHPEALDYQQLVKLRRPDAALPTLFDGPLETRRARDGFELTDARYDRRNVMSEVHYCLLCHDVDKDSCSKGLRAKDGSIKPNPLGVPLEGCPLDEKISEMHAIKAGGFGIGALAMVLVDNPMAPGTGHRICNDCMKSCVFQKQEPVNIPQAETGVLTDVVLELPWGFEIYGLLTRWNPLDLQRPHALGYNGRNVLVVGMGPAGYTLAHHLMNEGFAVAGVDGLKVEPLPDDLTGRDGKPPRAIRDYRAMIERLDRRILAGFGGVAEYGITVRWDKNFLAMIYLTLMRRDAFRLYGGVRFGGTVTLEDAWELGFDHVALATGAGRPTLIPMKNNLIRGIRKASDFLMALQLTGAFKRDSLANLQIELPALVIGGGLTGIDTATELLAYYPVQVEKTLARYQALVLAHGEAAVRARYDEEERAVLDRLLAHGRELAEERKRARVEGRAPDLVGLVRKWGGVKMVYRKTLQDSPAYRLNHEEVVKALEEGIEYVECVSPVEAVADERGHVRAVRFEQQAEVSPGKWRSAGTTLELPARAVLVAAGTHPNTIYEKERPKTFAMSGSFFTGHRAAREGDKVVLTPAAAGDREAFFTSYLSDGRTVTYYGDNHPVYEGNVVKAMASAKHGFRHVAALFAHDVARAASETEAGAPRPWPGALWSKLDDDWRAVVVDVKRLTPTIVEVIVRAPAAARRFQPGQFYRLQNFETLAPTLAVAEQPTRLTMEGLALTGAWVDPARGLLSMIVLEMGVSSRLCAALKPDEPVVVMGPTGAPTEIPSGETVLLAGGGLGNAVLFSIARALKAAGSKVIYFAGYKRAQDLFKQDEIEAATDQVIWAVDPPSAPIAARRPQDRSFVGNIVQAIAAYAEGKLGQPLCKPHDFDRIIAIGSDRMMNAVRVARRTGGLLQPHLKPGHHAIGSINSPMQCMMKEVCAQCLQKHVDPETGAEKGVVFSCFNQDQPLDQVDFAHLAQRLRQSSVAEKLSNQWLDLLLEGRQDLLRV